MDKNNKFTGDLFDNPMIRAAKEALSEQDKKRYEEIGKELYGNIDFEKSEILNNIPLPMIEAIKEIELQLISGLHPSMMDINEINIMKEAYGDNWYEKYGYIKEDLKSIVTLQPNLQPNFK